MPLGSGTSCRGRKGYGGAGEGAGEGADEGRDEGHGEGRDKGLMRGVVQGPGRGPDRNSNQCRQGGPGGPSHHPASRPAGSGSLRTRRSLMAPGGGPPVRTWGCCFRLILEHAVAVEDHQLPSTRESDSVDHVCQPVDDLTRAPPVCAELRGETSLSHRVQCAARAP